MFAPVLIILALLPLALGTADQSPALAIRNVTVVPATGGPAMPATTVVVRGDRIAMIGPASEVTIPTGTRIVDGTGKFLLPGFIDLHVHLSMTRASAMGLFVVNGVTTVRDMGGDYEELLRWRREVTTGKRIGPRVLMAGPALESPAWIERMRGIRVPNASGSLVPLSFIEGVRVGVGSPEEARTTVARLASLEIDFLKIRTVQDRPTYLAINEAANAHGIALVGHVTGLSPQLVLEAGQDGIDHTFARPFDHETREERMAMWHRFAEAGVPITPTLISRDAGLVSFDRLRAIVDDDSGEIEPRRLYLSKSLIAQWREQLGFTSVEIQQTLQRIRDERMPDIREMHEAGMEVLAGTDVGGPNIFPGSSLHDELALFVREVGMTPAEAIERATRRSARFLHIVDSVGTVERGKVADLVLLDADPLQDITNTRRIVGVVLRGQCYDPGGLEMIRAQVLAAPDVQVDDEQAKTK